MVNFLRYIRLATVLVIIIQPIWNCHVNSGNYSRRNKDDLLIPLALIYLIENQHGNPPLEASECTAWSGTNRGFNSRYTDFRNDTKQYENIILGDSTMDISGRYEGFLDPKKTQNLAVGGNNLCDMNRQMFVIQTENPSHILISTAGGNELIQDISLENRVRSLELLLQKVSERYPNTFVSLVGVHPTRIPELNIQRPEHNTAMKNAFENFSGNINSPCWVNPLPLFGDGSLGENDPAPASDMIILPGGNIDPVHYNQSISFALKSLLEDECNLSI